MGNRYMDIIAPLDSPLPPPIEGDVLTESQWETLMAIADTIIPFIEVSSTPSLNKVAVQASEYEAATEKLKKSLATDTNPELPRKYMEENPSSLPGFRQALQRTLGEHVGEGALKGIRVILSTLDTRAGCLLATGYATFFHLQPVGIRQQILQSWQKSYLPPLRKIVAAFSGLTVLTWVRQSPTIGRVLGFPRTPVHGKPGKGFEYSFIQFPPGLTPEVLETDVVIVGSGCGAGPTAKNLAESGNQVIVVEKAYHFPAEHLPMREADAGIHLFMNGGSIQSDDGSIVVIAGQSFGGGGTVNWSASLQTQAFVRQEWADNGLSFFTSSEFQKSLDRVCHRMGVSADHIEHNPNNQFLLEGARKLGYSAKAVPQNTGGVKHYDGYCTLGCGATEKQGPVVSFLPDAERAGAKFIEGFEADKVIFEVMDGKKIATAVKGRWTSRDRNGGVSDSERTTREVIIKAKRVVISAGTLQSPLILLRSGLTNPQIGKNLHLHPVTIVGATYPQAIRPWEGGILTAVVDEFQNLDCHGHGVKLEAMCMLPSWFLPFQPWTSGLDYKLECAKLPYMGGHITLVRDRDTGRVFPDPKDGRCRIEYTPSAFDRKHALEGVLACARIAYISGAKEILFPQPGLRKFVRDEPSPPTTATTNNQTPDQEDDAEGINNPNFQSWLQEIRAKGIQSPGTRWGSAHQMGTCRMGVSERTSVVDPTGKVWGVEGLYVADASVFPSASGVNPMVTNMAVCDWISRGVGKGLREEREGKGGGGGLGM